jgi:hypothetical protein
MQELVDNMGYLPHRNPHMELASGLRSKFKVREARTTVTKPDKGQSCYILLHRGMPVQGR